MQRKKTLLLFLFARAVSLPSFHSQSPTAHPTAFRQPLRHASHAATTLPLSLWTQHLAKSHARHHSQPRGAVSFADSGFDVQQAQPLPSDSFVHRPFVRRRVFGLPFFSDSRTQLESYTILSTALRFYAQSPSRRSRQLGTLLLPNFVLGKILFFFFFLWVSWWDLKYPLNIGLIFCALKFKLWIQLSFMSFGAGSKLSSVVKYGFWWVLRL